MTTIADYQVVQELGEGNHGVFHLARPPARLGLAEEFVAIKVLARNSTDADFDRFARELQVFSSVDSPHLVHLHEAGHQDGRLFYAMRHYPDGSLADAALDQRATVQVLVDAAMGAHHLHEAGVIHRDIKPTNIMVNDGRGVLADLGLALVWEPGAKTTGVGPIGSVHYMEPEIIFGERATRTSDVWSLAITAAETLSGTRCYDVPEHSALAAFRHVLHNRPHVSESIPAPVRAVLERALDQTRGNRHPTAAAFAEDLATAGGIHT